MIYSIHMLNNAKHIFADEVPFHSLFSKKQMYYPIERKQKCSIRCLNAPNSPTYCQLSSAKSEGVFPSDCTNIPLNGLSNEPGVASPEPSLKTHTNRVSHLVLIFLSFFLSFLFVYRSRVNLVCFVFPPKRSFGLLSPSSGIAFMFYL